MTKRTGQNLRIAVTGVLLVALLLVTVTSIPAMATAGLSAPHDHLQADARLAPATGHQPVPDGAAKQADMGGTGTACPSMSGGCAMISSAGHCPPPVLTEAVLLCTGNVIMTTALEPAAAPLRRVTLAVFHFRPPIA